MDDNLVNSLAQPQNSVQEGYQQVNSQVMAAQNLHDNNMLKVFEFAGDGQVDAAKAFAASKGIHVPPEVLSNADLAQGLHIAGSMYAKDPNAAQKFSVAWMQNQGLPLQQRVLVASQQAGAPIDPEDRKFRGMIAMLDWKKHNLPNAGVAPHGLSPGQARFNAGQKASDVATMATLNPAQQQAAAAAARENAYKEWDANNPNGGASPGLTGGYADSPDSPDDIDSYGNTIHQPQPDQNGDAGSYAPAPSASQTPTQSLASPSQIPSGLPAGSAKIGTSGGKDVYKDPAGNQYIDNGNN